MNTRECNYNNSKNINNDNNNSVIKMKISLYNYYNINIFLDCNIKVFPQVCHLQDANKTGFKNIFKREMCLTTSSSSKNINGYKEHTFR